MGTVLTLLATASVALLALTALPAEWADDVVLAAAAGLAVLAAIVGYARWESLERTMLAALGWPAE